jgi:hypothetical protein
VGPAPVKKLKIGYWPLSGNLDSAGDRRRLIFWATARDHTIVTDLNKKVDVIVASESADLNSRYFSKKHTPIIFDLVDAYLSPLSAIDDMARGIAKRTFGQFTGSIRPFSHHVREFCKNVDAVICSSIEQEAEIKPYNNNTHVILDSHEEIPFVYPSKNKAFGLGHHQILWEGQPATIRGVKAISSVLLEVSKTSRLSIEFVTDEKYFLFLNKFMARDTLDLLKSDLSAVSNLVKIVQWSPNNLVKSAANSDVAMIPINLEVPMQRLKPENRLLIMWRLGIPCLTSPSPAYKRVSNEAGVNAICENLSDWLENFNKVLSDPSYSLNEVINGQNYLRDNHTREILLKKWDDAFASVMS